MKELNKLCEENTRMIDISKGLAKGYCKPRHFKKGEFE